MENYDTLEQLFSELEALTNGDLDWDSLHEYFKESSSSELDHVEAGLTWVIGALS